MTFEFAILDFIQTHLRSGVGDVLMTLITTLGNGGAIWVALGLVLCLYRKTRRWGVAVLLALVIQVVLSSGILKPFVGRIRPCDINATVPLLIAHPTDFSFPSGHTGAAFATVAALAFGRCKGWLAAGVLAVLMAFSRLYLYVHFPTDVLAGAMLGILCGWLAVILMDRFAKKT